MRRTSSLIVIGAIGLGLLGPAIADAALSPYYAVDRVNAVGAEPNGASSDPALSGNGRYVAFASTATNLVGADANNASDVFVRDLQTNAIVRVSVDSTGAEGGGDSSEPAISDDGRFVAFLSDHEFVNEDENGVTDAYVHDRDADVDGTFDEVGATSTYRVSSEGGIEVENAISGVKISGDGNWVAIVTDFSFQSNDQNDSDDVYVRGVATDDDVMRRISRGSTVEGGGGDLVTISQNGRYVGFRTFAFDIAPANVSGYYLRDRDADNDGIYDETGAAQKFINVSNPSSGSNVARFVSYAALSADARLVAFTANGTDLVPGAVNNSLYLRDRDSDGNGVFDDAGGATLEIASVSNAGGVVSAQRPVFSPDRHYLGFESAFPGIVPGDEPGIDAFVRDLAADTVVRTSVRRSGLSANGSVTIGGVDNAGTSIFASTGTNLVEGDGNAASDIFRSRLTSAPAYTYTARLTADEYAQALQAAAHFGVPVDELARRGTWSLAFIVALNGGNPGGPAPAQPNDGPVVLHTTYTSGENFVTEYIGGELALDGDSMHVLGVRFMIFVWMLETNPAT